MDNVTNSSGGLFYICGEKAAVNLKYIKYIAIEVHGPVCDIVAVDAKNNVIVLDSAGYETANERFKEYMNVISAMTKPIVPIKE